MINKTELSKKASQVKNVLVKLDKLVVAFSGGVDSTLILSLAIEVLGKNNVKAVYFSSCLQTIKHEKQILNFIKSQFGSDDFFGIIKFNPLNDKDFIKNNEQRCYICKKNIYAELISQFSSFSSNIVDGTNFSDLSDDRPGYRAIKELGILTPLADSYITKKEIRKLAKQRNLQNWDLPSNSCLATRVIEGEEITKDSLYLIEKAERYLSENGLSGIRVRKDNNNAIVMIPELNYDKVINSNFHKDISNQLTVLGFESVSFKELPNKE